MPNAPSVIRLTEYQPAAVDLAFLIQESGAPLVHVDHGLALPARRQVRRRLRGYPARPRSLLPRGGGHASRRYPRERVHVAGFAAAPHLHLGLGRELSEFLLGCHGWWATARLRQFAAADDVVDADGTARTRS